MLFPILASKRSWACPPATKPGAGGAWPAAPARKARALNTRRWLLAAVSNQTENASSRGPGLTEIRASLSRKINGCLELDSREVACFASTPFFVEAGGSRRACGVSTSLKLHHRPHTTTLRLLKPSLTVMRGRLVVTRELSLSNIALDTNRPERTPTWCVSTLLARKSTSAKRDALRGMHVA